MGALEDLEEVVQAAKAATDDLLGKLAVHGLTTEIRGVPLEPDQPIAVRAGFDLWQERIKDIIRVLARQDGIAPGVELSEKDRAALTIRACVLALGFV
jgi:hypothetical protein